MKKCRAVFALCLIVAALTGLAGCQKDTEKAAVYVQGELDAVYRGTCAQAYFDLVKDMTGEDVQETYRWNIEYEAEYLLEWLDVGWPNGEVSRRAREVAAAICARSRYAVGEAARLKGGALAVPVAVEPVELFRLIGPERYEQVWDEVLDRHGVSSGEELDALSGEAYSSLESEYGLILLDDLETRIPSLTYGTEQTVVFLLEPDAEGYYAIADGDRARLDELIIDYYGDGLS